MDVEKERRKEPNLQDKKSKIEISDEFLNELIKYDYTSTKKGRGYSSLLIERKAKKQRDQNRPQRNTQQTFFQNNQSRPNQNELQILRPPDGVMDVRKWYEQLNSKEKDAYQRGMKGLSGNKSEADYMHNQNNHVNGFSLGLGNEAV